MPSNAELLANSLDPYPQQADPTLLAVLENPAAPDVPVQSSYLANLGGAPTVQSTGGTVRTATPLGQAIGSGIADSLMAPGRAFTGEMQVRDPQTGALSQDATDWGAGTALGMLGGSSIPRVPVAAGEMAVGSGPIRAYHGSPHDFDAFDLSKIGTGEGAQAYGHGLYFAENEAVAKQYRDVLGYKHTNGAPKVNWDDPQQVASYWTSFHGGDRAAAADYLEGALRQNSRMKNFNGAPEIVGALDILKNDVPITAGAPNPGRMYEVNIHADPQRLLDLDGTLAPNHPARSILNDAAKAAYEQADYGAGRNAAKDAILAARSEGLTGTGAYNSLVRSLADAPAFMPGGEGYFKPASVNASALLNEAGIPGSKYLDQGSRGGDRGTRNYVVFDPKIVEVMRKYGVASIAALPPAVLASMGMDGTEQMQNPAQLDPNAPQT